MASTRVRKTLPPPLRRAGGPNLNCRFYENEFPDVEDVVIVEVKQIADMGAYVQLLEYNNTEGPPTPSLPLRRCFRHPACPLTTEVLALVASAHRPSRHLQV